jgi:hypothetical protein
MQGLCRDFSFHKSKLKRFKANTQYSRQVLTIFRGNNYDIFSENLGSIHFVLPRFFANAPLDLHLK